MKRLLKPFFMQFLYLVVALRWRFRKPGRMHKLPDRLVVSLTSYPKRFDALEPTLKTLLTQTVAADATILWVAESDMALLPQGVRELEKYGLTIRPCEDLRSYKKIIPALADYSDAFIVTCDDDVYYPSNWLETFCDAYFPGERNALAYRAHRMLFESGGLKPYEEWDFEITSHETGNDIFFTGVGGVLYPPGILSPDVTRSDMFMALCPAGDDIWLNWMVRLNGGKVRKVGPKQRFYEWPGSQGVALQNVNRGSGVGNDEQLANIVEKYGIPGF